MAAINKNFVIKNGLEVNNNLIFADIVTDKVGIGTTNPQYTLHVSGGIGATDAYVSGIGTIVTLQSTTGTITNLTATNLFVGVGTIGRIQSTDINNSGVTTSTTLNITGTATIAVGVVTFLSGTNLNYSGIGTIDSLNSTNVNVSGVGTIVNARVTNLNVTGISTFSSVNTGNINIAGIVTGLNVSGVGTIVNARVTNLNVTGVSTIASLSVTGSTFDTLVVNNFSTLNGITTLTNARVTNLNVTGISTFSSVNTGNINISGIVTGLNVSGVSTLGTVRISSGIITATSGIVTYFGDGQYLTGLAANPTLQTVLNTGNTSTIGFSITGVSTLTTLNSTSGDITNLSGVAINISGIATAQDFDALSDINYKENVITVNNALNKVEQLRGVSFDWKENGRSSYGVIAQELQKVLPELVHGDNPKTVNYNGIIGVLIEAIKELKKEVEELKNLII